MVLIALFPNKKQVFGWTGRVIKLVQSKNFNEKLRLLRLLLREQHNSADKLNSEGGVIAFALNDNIKSFMMMFPEAVGRVVQKLCR